MKTTLSFLASICAFAFSVHAEQSSTWEKMPVYIVKEGHLYRVDALSPVLPGYVGYSIYYDQAGQTSSFTGDEWRDAFAKGYYAYRKTDDPLKPFERVTLPSPPDIVRQVQNLPRFTTEKDYTKEAPPRCLMLPSDTYTPYWRRIDEMLGMADSLGRVFFFPGQPGQERRVAWKGGEAFPLRDATPLPNAEGWLAIRYAGAGGKDTLAWLHPVTGEFRPSAARSSGENEYLDVDLVQSAWLNDDTVVMHWGMRWCDHLNVVRLSTGENMLNNRLNGMGLDVLVSDNQVWSVDGQGFVAQLYPVPVCRPEAPLQISLEHEGNHAEEGSMTVMNLKVTVSNRGTEPINLPQGWGTFVYRFSGGADSWKGALVEQDKAEDAPAVTLKPGETSGFLRKYEVYDYRIFPHSEQVRIMVSLTPELAPESPGAEVTTSDPITIPTPIP